ncbi:synaptonemal complex protein 1-like [Abrus precatorius]|uniref:Synaptonemal complex protein 1-like n=1 Tax=Abrus precatorius TaxID=3816 RepID=A0A8B8MKF5_ABRPR|nr:synaptonemal complex protein 1-like [Abrus precatorius]
MQKKLGFPISKSLDQFKSLYGSIPGTAKPLSSRPSKDSISSGSFANLKLTAEKLVKEQASVKTDLENANAKLKKSQEHIHALEEKLQNAFNENAKLKVKQNEDEKLWKGLESKFSSTKTLCDQLTETLQHLAGLVQDAEKDKETLENKLSSSSEALDSLNKQMDGLSLKLDSSLETIRSRDNELEKLKFATEEREKFHRDEQCRAATIVQEKDTMITNLEEMLTASKLATENLNSKLGEVHHQLKVKEDENMNHITSQEKLEKEKNDLQLNNAGLTEKLNMSLQEIKNLEGSIQALAAHLLNLDKESLNLLSKFDEMNLVYGSCFKLLQQERETYLKHAQYKYNDLNNNFLILASEKNVIEMKNCELSKTVNELQKVQESTIAQHVMQSQLAAERIQSLESEAETLISKNAEAEVFICKLEEKVENLLESSRSSDNKMQSLLLKVSALETENKENEERLQADLLKKSEEIDTLQKERMKLEQHADSLDKEVIQLHNVLDEKEQCILQYKEQEKKLEDQITENQSLLTAAESKLSEAKKQYDQMVENKQLELSRHLKEISQRNDQAINDIKRKYELEKMEIVNMEKDKAHKAIEEIEGKCGQKLAECKEESRQQLIHIQEEHTLLVTQMQQEQEKRQLSLIAEQNEQLKRSQLEAENELREKTMFLRNDHEAQIKALRCELEDECRKLEEELHLQKSKEERQRALLQLQWKVMSDKPKEDQEVNSKQDYSISSIKRRSSCGGKRRQRELDSPYFEATQTPVPKLLKKMENVKTGSATSIPNHHRKVTRHEYEVETSNGRTITKKRKTRSTVMFEDPRNQKINTPKVNTPGSIVKSIKGGGHPHPSNIGDLFSEGSLNPYADDPYAFD